MLLPARHADGDAAVTNRHNLAPNALRIFLYQYRDNLGIKALMIRGNTLITGLSILVMEDNRVLGNEYKEIIHGVKH